MKLKAKATEQIVKHAFLFIVVLALSGCLEVEPPTPAPQTARSAGNVTVSSLRQVSARVIPVAVTECRQRTRARCDFQVGVDEDPSAPPNAFQTEAADGTPMLIFTETLLKDLQNVHELAFILGHEAAHHIEGHLDQTNRNATSGALIGGLTAAIFGADTSVIESASRIGGTVGARRYSKDFELEADFLGARITQRAGYDAVRGAEYFTRIADPGNRFLGTHPPNADRINTVRGAVAGL